MNRAELVEQVLLWSAVADQAKARAAAAREALNEAAAQELVVNGSAPTWRIPGLGVVPLRLSSDQVVVDDEALYLDFVQAEYPTEVVLIVRPAFHAALLAAAAEAGDPPVDPTTGQIIPGLRFIPGGQPRGVSVRPVGDTRRRMLERAREILDQAGGGDA